MSPVTATPKNDGITSRESNQWLAPSSAAAGSIVPGARRAAEGDRTADEPGDEPERREHVEELEEEIHAGR